MSSIRISIPLFLVTLLIPACASADKRAEPATPTAGAQATPPTPAQPAGDTKPQDPAEKAAADAKAKQEADEKKAEERKGLEKEVRNKLREIDYFAMEQQVAAIDRGVRQQTLQLATERVARDLAKAEKELELFEKEHKPREIDERKISMDQQTNYTEEQKDEFGELEAMYKEDEFAKTTKELVLKRGRRQMEMAERRLAIARREDAVWANHTLPERERDLRQKVEDARFEAHKQQKEVEKAVIEFKVADRKAEERQGDLRQELGELEAKLAKLAKESS